MSIYLFISLLFGLSSCTSNGHHRLTNFESLIPSEEKAFNREMLINIDGDSIAAYAMIASGHERKETVILVSGYPGNDNNFDIAQEIRRKGRNVIQFNHRGAWGSQGRYSYSNCLKDIDHVIQFLSNPQMAAALRIDTAGFVLLGRSYGGGIALIQGSQNPLVQKIIAITSVNYGLLMDGYSELEELGRFRSYMEKQIMINHDIDQFLTELLNRKKEFNVLSYKEELLRKEVLLIEDSKKNQSWIKEIRNATSIILPSDHNFIEERLELQEIIVQWLDEH